MKTPKLKTAVLFAGVIALFSSCDRVKDLVQDYQHLHPGFTVSSVAPLEGEPGSVVLIHGRGFAKDSASTEIRFDGTLAKVISSNDSLITVRVPETNSAQAALIVVQKNVPWTKTFNYHFFDVYVTGRVYDGTRNYARLWKNGTVQNIFADTLKAATLLSRYGKDIYFGTSDGYYKNSTHVRLPPAYGNSGYTLSVAVYRDTVVATGNGGLYKNGVFVPLRKYSKSNYPQFSFLAVHNDTLYAADSDPFSQQGILFKNGVNQPQQFGDRHAYAAVIAFKGNEVHLGGENNEKNPTGAEWVNGRYEAAAPLAYVNDIIFHGQDEYATGPSVSNVFYLKNSGVVPNPEPGRTFNGNALFWAGQSSLYVAGAQATTALPYGSSLTATSLYIPSYPVDAVYFRNGLKTVLDKGAFKGAVANSILVVER